MREYLELGHMRLASSNNDINLDSARGNAVYFLPHHCVKTSDQGSKVRIASCQTSTEVSLNNCLMIGPIVQQDLISILMRFRIFLYVITVDIIKMYKFSWIQAKRAYSVFFGVRTQFVMGYSNELTTVTYGTASASYLAMRCLKQLSSEYARQFPIGAECLARDFYVDDLLTGADTVNEIRVIRNQLIAILKQGKFELSKFKRFGINRIVHIAQGRNERADKLTHTRYIVETKLGYILFYLQDR